MMFLGHLESRGNNLKQAHKHFIIGAKSGYDSFPTEFTEKYRKRASNSKLKAGLKNLNLNSSRILILTDLRLRDVFFAL